MLCPQVDSISVGGLLLSRQYITVSVALAEGATVYGLGEHVSDSLQANTTRGATMTMWTRDQATPVGQQFNLWVL